MQRPGKDIPSDGPLTGERGFQSLIGRRPGGATADLQTGVVKSFPLKPSAKIEKATSDRIAAALTLLRSGRRSERIGAAREIGDIALTKRIKIPQAIVPLTVTLTTDVDPSAREEAAWSLWKLCDERSHDALMRAMLGDPVPAVREKCARVLGLLGAASAIPVMLDLLSLKRHVPARLRAGIASAFGYLAGEELLPHLMKLADDAEPLVRYEAVRSLGRYLVGFESSISDRVFRLIRRYLKTRCEPCGLIRRAAVKAMRFSAGGAASAAVARVLGKDPDAETRQTAAEALIVWDHPACERALMDALADDSWQVRKSAARTLCKFLMRYRAYDTSAVCEALRRMERMLPAHSLEWRLAADAFASL